MPAAGGNEEWMRPALDWLFDHATIASIQNALRNPDDLRMLRSELQAAVQHSHHLSLPPGERGDNLIMALIALRLKFSRAEAEDKLETNLTLRRQA